ncbi:hypothetical protein PR002_g29710, partial [Phytophthora rubi]
MHDAMNEFNLSPCPDAASGAASSTSERVATWLWAPPKPRKSSTNVAASDGNLPTGAPVDQGRSPANPKKDSKYKTSSIRLGGTDLTSFRDAVGSKRAFEEDKETLEASFAKAKRIRAMKATTSLKNKLNGLESTA